MANRTVDYEEVQWLNFTVRASDNGSPRRSAEIPVYLQIVDINDNNPVFSQPSYQVSWAPLFNSVWCWALPAWWGQAQSSGFSRDTFSSHCLYLNHLEKVANPATCFELAPCWESGCAQFWVSPVPSVHPAQAEPALPAPSVAESCL